MSWQPRANKLALTARSAMYQDIRQFFAERKVLEVETPLLASTTVTDPYTKSIRVSGNRFLQTSPEYFMKRLLAADIGDIFQICKVFREGDSGSRHNPEFTMLEWYRVGFDQWDLMDEVSDLLEMVLGVSHFEHLSYRDVFAKYLGLDPFEADIDTLKFEAQQHINVEMLNASKDDWLNLLMSHMIEPYLGQDAPVFVYDYPPTQAALARINNDEGGCRVAERFELYFKGLELLNGYHELSDAAIQKDRFHADNIQRLAMGLPAMPIDHDLLAAMEEGGLPDCAGVALGLDRLLMIKLKTDRIEDVLGFRAS